MACSPLLVYALACRSSCTRNESLGRRQRHDLSRYMKAATRQIRAPVWMVTALMVSQSVLTTKGADLIRVPVHSPPSPSVLQAVCHSHTAGHQSRHRGEYSGAHRVTQKS